MPGILPVRPTPAERAHLEGLVFARRAAEDGERHAPAWRGLASLARQNGATRAAVEALWPSEGA